MDFDIRQSLSVPKKNRELPVPLPFGIQPIKLPFLQASNGNLYPIPSLSRIAMISF